MGKYVNKDGSFNHGKWLRETQLNEGRLQDELEGLIRDLDKNGYSRFADDYDIDPNDANEMMDWIANIPDRDAKRIIKDFKKGMYEGKLNEKETDTNSPSWQLVRALNSLGNDLRDTKHKKMMAWGEKYSRSVPDTIKLIETLHKFVKKLK